MGRELQDTYSFRMASDAPSQNFPTSFTLRGVSSSKLGSVSSPVLKSDKFISHIESDIRIEHRLCRPALPKLHSVLAPLEQDPPPSDHIDIALPDIC